MDMDIGLLLGILGLVLSGWLYWRSGKDLQRELQAVTNELKAETTTLRRLNGIILEDLEAAGRIELNRDEQGNIIGIRQYLRASSGVSSAATATLSVETPQRSDPDAGVG